MSLLEEFYRLAFDEGDDRYLGEIAGKLRLLVLRAKRNKPLLLDLMEHYNSEVKIHFNGPFNKEPVSVDGYLDSVAFFVRLSDGPIQFTRREFVEAWSQQNGSAHEDTSHDRRYATSRNLGIYIGGEQSHKWNLGAITRTILSVTRAFFTELEDKGVVHRLDS